MIIVVIVVVVVVVVVVCAIGVFCLMRRVVAGGRMICMKMTSTSLTNVD